MDNKTRQIMYGGGVVFALLILLGGIKFFQIRAASSMAFQPPPEAVTSYTVAEVSWPRGYEAVGSVSPVQGVTLSAEESGRVSKILVESGAVVAAGDVLVELNTAVEEAELAGARARLDLARHNLERMRVLVPSKAMAKADLDTAESEYRNAEAQVATLRAQIDRRRVTAPFAGRAGIRKVNLGQYVAAGVEILPLYSLNRLYVDFSLPQKAIQDLRPGQRVVVRSDDAESLDFAGEIAAVNPQIETTSRMVGVRAVVTNREEKLRPGMFVRVEVLVAENERYLSVPSSSINFAPYGDSVYVIESVKAAEGQSTPMKSVRQQGVALGPRRGDRIAIVSGLAAGDEIVSSGVFKLRPGAHVVINNSLAPANDPAPQPADT